MKKYLVLTLISAFLLSCSSENQTNLVPNPGFETGMGEEPSPWVKLVTKNVQSYQMGVTGEEFHSGKYSYKISRVWCYPWQQTGFKTPVKIDPQKKYILSFW